MKNRHFFKDTLHIILYRPILHEDEKNSRKTNFWQRFRAKKQVKTPTQAVSFRSLVNKVINILLLSS
jgi:hypothetical protein